MATRRERRKGEVRLEGRPDRVIQALGAALAVTASLSVFGSIVLEQRRIEAIETARWSLAGPPCAVTGDALVRGGRRSPMEVTFEGIVFERRSGYIQCTHRPYDLGRGRARYVVCDFNTPQAVGVTIGRDATFFAQPINRSLRIAIADDRPVCVLIRKLPMK